MSWQEQHAAATDFEVGELERALSELDNVEAIADARGSGKLAAEVRAVASAIRSEVAAMRSEARGLRAAAADRPAVLPMTVTRGGRRLSMDYTSSLRDGEGP